MTASYESLAVIEDFFGEELSADLISRFASMPNYQLRELLSRIDYAFKHGIPRRVRAVQGTSLSAQIAPFQPIFSNDTNLSFFAPAVISTFAVLRCRDQRWVSSRFWGRRRG